MKIKLWDRFPVCPSELAKQLFPLLGNSCWKRIKKKKDLFPRKGFTFHSQEIKRTGYRFCQLVLGLSQRQDAGLAGERASCELNALVTVVFCLFGLVKSLYLDRKGSLSVCVVHLSTRPWWLSSFLAWHDLILSAVSLLDFQKELSVHFALLLCFYWFFWKASLFRIRWILLNSFSVLCDKGLCQERYKGSLWCIGNPFLLVRQCNTYFSFTCGLYFPSALLVLQ